MSAKGHSEKPLHSSCTLGSTVYRTAMLKVPEMAQTAEYMMSFLNEDFLFIFDLIDVCFLNMYL